MKMIKVENKNDLFYLTKSEFQTLHSKGFGIEKNKKYFLDIYEIIYLLEKNKIKVYNIKNKLINIEKLKNKKIFNLNEYLVFKDLKSKGYNIKSGLKFGVQFRIYDKGIKPGEDHSLWLIEVLNEKDKIKIKDLTGKNRIAHSTNKKLIFAILDSELSITYIENNWKRL